MKNDIINYIKIRWPKNYFDVIEIINKWDATTKRQLEERLIRSVLFLSSDNIDSIQEIINLSRIDYRDVYYQAEYECGHTNIRDFNKTFYDNKII